MTLYTPYPIEEIMRGADESIAPLEEMEVNGVLFQVRRIDANQAVIERLISPEPAHYLNPKYAPGQMISLNPHL